MSKKKKSRPTASIPTGGYTLVKTLGGLEGGSGGDELDQTMKQVQKMQTDKLKTMMIKKAQVEMEKEIRDMEKSMGQGGGAPMSITVEDVQLLSQLPEEQRGVAVQALVASKSQGTNATGILAPALVTSILQRQPQTGVTELVVALKGMMDIIQTGKAPATDVNSIVSIAQMLLGFKDKDQSAIVELYKELARERNVDPLAQTESVLNLAKALGMSPAGVSNPEVERDKLHWEDVKQQREHDHELLLKKMDRDDEWKQTIINMIGGPLQKLAEAFTPGLAATIGAGAGTVLAQKQLQSQPQQGSALSVKCPCGYEPIWVSEETPVAICPNCNQRVTHPAFKDRTGAQSPQNLPPSSPDGGLPPPPR